MHFLWKCNLCLDYVYRYCLLDSLKLYIIPAPLDSQVNGWGGWQTYNDTRNHGPDSRKALCLMERYTLSVNILLICFYLLRHLNGTDESLVCFVTSVFCPAATCKMSPVKKRRNVKYQRKEMLQS